MSITTGSRLPLIVTSLYTHHLVKICGYPEYSLGCEAIQGQDLLSQGGQDPWKTTVGKLVLLNIEGLHQRSSKHGRSEDLESRLINVLQCWLLGSKTTSNPDPLQSLVTDAGIVGDLNRKIVVVALNSVLK